MARREVVGQGQRRRASQTAPSSASLSAAMWGMLEAQPGLNKELRAAEAELEAGGGVLYEVRGNALRKARHQG